MKNNDYKKIVNGIKIPEQKLDLVKNSILQKKASVNLNLLQL